MEHKSRGITVKKGKGGWASPHQDLLGIVALAKEVGNGRRNRKKQ